MKNITTGIVAHVDAGKTTLSEALLFNAGTVRKLGRVDNGDSFLDPDDLEKKRGITIFSHQATLTYHDLNLTLLDTPGHMDFAGQTEQVLSVLDYAILVITATDDIPGYTRTLWHLLEEANIPTFIFINKMDVPGVVKEQVLAKIKQAFSSTCIDFSLTNDETLSDSSYEEIALQDEVLLNHYLETSNVPDQTIQQLIANRTIFPCYFGSALKTIGVEPLLQGIEKWTISSNYSTDFSARVFKISYDEKGERLTWLKVTGGVLHNKTPIFNDQKANQLRVYNGAKFTLNQTISAGNICAVTGLTDTSPGQGLGQTTNVITTNIQPVLTYTLNPKNHDIHDCLVALRQLEDEDPLLHVTWSTQLNEIRLQIMGPIQLEIIQQLLLNRFNLDIDFGEGNILYKETIMHPIEGIGHFEPLRHYAEVHLLMEPLSEGSGLIIDSQLPLDILDRNWQNQILTSLKAKEHIGVLTGMPLTNVKITLIAGRAHIKHSSGGDFREATWRAVRQGLMMLKEKDQMQLLEPWYKFRLELSQDHVGRAMTDIQSMSGLFDAPQISDIDSTMAIITGYAPVATMQDYARDVRNYTHGIGQLDCVVADYRPCHNANDVIDTASYNPTADLDNTPDSVFCAHGAGYPVPWNQVPDMAHIQYLTK